MKKLQYIQPKTTIIRMQTAHMIAASEMNFNDSNGKSGVILSRENRNWDEDDWDDEDF